MHGRLQPPHNGHLKYLLAAKERCSFLWIGIARYDIREEIPCALAGHRAERASNPLTYFERMSIITEMLGDSGLPRSSFGFTPFPIDKPEKLTGFLPTSVPCFMAVYDDWDRHKVKTLSGLGYEVVVLWEGGEKEKDISGRTIRDSIRQGTRAWEAMVPGATRKALHALQLGTRL